MLRGRNSQYWFLILIILSVCQVLVAQTKQNTSPSHEPKSSVPGRASFNSTCAGCHGLDGHGSDKAVNIASGRARALSDTQLASIISNGIPETGMPAFHTLTQAQVHALVSYLRSLQGKAEARVLPGDPKRGRELFFGKGGCAACHSISGEGGFLGPDLTEYAATNSPEGLRNEITKFPRTPAHGYRPAVVTTTRGERLEGLIRNEDNFSMQLQTADGNFHLLRKSDVQSCEHRDGSLMPANYRDKFSDSELNDLVSYLMKTPNPNRKAAPAKFKDDYE
jgi:putative heme-binding domain-containing protein